MYRVWGSPWAWKVMRTPISPGLSSLSGRHRAAVRVVRVAVAFSSPDLEIEAIAVRQTQTNQLTHSQAIAGASRRNMHATDSAAERLDAHEPSLALNHWPDATSGQPSTD